MSVFQLTPQPAHDRQAFANRIQVILDRGWPITVALGPGALTARPGWKRDPDARLILMLDGVQRYAWLDREAASERRFSPGEAVWFAPGAAMREDWSESCHFLSVVLRPQFLRIIVGRCRGEGRHPGTSPWSHHAALPLSEPGLQVAHALDRLADGLGDPACAPELARALLRLAREHASRCAEVVPGRAAATWRRVQEHVAAHCHCEISRAATARALGLNPTYLSDLCQRHSGGGFVRVVEEVRLERARLLLRSEPELPVAAIAKRVGFASAGYFARVFRRATGRTPVQWSQRPQ
jgi:AraC-like DNA-binding protein